MESIAFVTSRKLLAKDVNDFVIEREGKVSENNKFPGGLIQGKRSFYRVRRPTVWISLSSKEIFTVDYGASEINQIRKIIGAEPKSAINFDISHTNGSKALALDLVLEMIERWGGVLDRNLPRFDDLSYLREASNLLPFKEEV